MAEQPAEWHRFALLWTSASEQARAASYFHTADATRHLLGRTLLRVVLGHEIGVDALPEVFPINSWGKPQLPGSHLEFSISHAGDAVWLAVARDTAVGIDVEAACACTSPGELLGVLHAEEQSAIRTALPSEMGPHFLRCWTRKESVIKALGMGVSCPLDSFCVATDTQPRDWLRRSPYGPPSEWTCTDLPVNDGYHLSLAVMAPNVAVSCHYLELTSAGFLIMHKGRYQT